MPVPAPNDASENATLQGPFESTNAASNETGGRSSNDPNALATDAHSHEGENGEASTNTGENPYRYPGDNFADGT